jgi:hypothetical protein
MKTIALLSAATSALLFSSCVSSPSKADDHWSNESIAPRVARVMLGYDPDQYDSYRDYAWENKLAISLTLQRHLLCWNPENPYQPADPDYYAPRPLNSPLPNPLTYFGIESVVIGSLIYAGAGVFIPIPIDSMIGTLEPGGEEEFVAGLTTTFRPLRVLTVSFLDDALSLPPYGGNENEPNVSSYELVAQ